MSVFDLHTISPTNLLLIDENVPNYSFLVESANSSTTCIVYSESTTKSVLFDLISSRFSTISRIGVCSLANTSLLFVNDQITSENTESIIQLITQFQVQTMDFLACETLLDNEWLSFYSILKSRTGVIVGASNDKTGNILYGGDWEMESTSENVETVYFQSSIQYYTYLLDLTHVFFAYSRTGDLYSCGNAVFINEGEITPLPTLTSVYTSIIQSSAPIVNIVATTASNGTNNNIFVLLQDNALWAKGVNAYGSLGLGGTVGVQQLIQVEDLPNKIIQTVISGLTFSIIQMTDGTLYGAGTNGAGQLGLSSLSSSYSFIPMPVPDNKVVKQVACGIAHTVALMTDGTVYSCGNNVFYKLGLDVSGNVYQFTQITLPAGKRASSIACGKQNTIIVMTDNTLYVVGYNGFGQLGVGDTTNVSTLTQVMNLPSGKISAVLCGENHSILILSNGNVYGCGRNDNGQLGLVHTNTQTTFSRVCLLPETPIVGAMCQYNGTVIVCDDGTLYATGENTVNGWIGLDTIPYVSTFTQVPVPYNAEIAWVNNITYITPVCFGENALILTDRGYIPINQLRERDLVKTYKHGFKPIVSIASRTMYQSSTTTRSKTQLYQCTIDKYPELFTDLLLTGSHSILVDSFTTREKEKAIEVLGDIYQTDDKLRLPVCADNRSRVYPVIGKHRIYHIALENQNETHNYGIYANGLLVESCSIRYLRDFSDLTPAVR